MGKRELVALPNLSSWCLVTVERLFLAVPQGCLRFVIVVFPDHTHLLFFILKTQLNPPVNGKIQGLFQASECFSSTFQSKFNFQRLFKTVLHIQVLFKPVGTLFEFSRITSPKDRFPCNDALIFTFSKQALIESLDFCNRSYPHERYTFD